MLVPVHASRYKALSDITRGHCIDAHFGIVICMRPVRGFRGYSYVHVLYRPPSSGSYSFRKAGWTDTLVHGSSVVVAIPPDRAESLERLGFLSFLASRQVPCRRLLQSSL